MNDNMYLTAAGAARLRTELEELKGPKRKALAKVLRTAIQQGDLSENADYIAAKEEQGFLEGRIQELEHILREAVIVEKNSGPADVVAVGCTVTVQFGDDPPDTYQLVGQSEADPRSGRISNESPIGEALIGRKVGDEVTAETPGGTIQLTILKIQ